MELPRIYIHDRHTPHLDSLCMSMFGHAELHVSGWNEVFRNRIVGVSVTPMEEARSQDWELVIDDDPELPTEGFKTRIFAFLQHCEFSIGDPQYMRIPEKIFSTVDVVFSVSRHKMLSLRDFSFSPKIVLLPFCFPQREGYPFESRDIDVACFHNVPNEYHVDFWLKATSGFNARMIGPNTSPAVKSLLVHSEEEFWSYAKRVKVYLNVVVGEAFGMAPYDAMSIGIPVVSGYTKDCGEIAFSGWNIMMSRNSALQDIPWIQWAIRELLDNEERNRSIGDAGQKSVRHHLSLERCRDSILGVLNK